MICKPDDDLEARVVERMRNLERIQTVLLRTGRLNTFAMLGACLTHDLNNVLGAIGLSVEVMRDDANTGRTIDRNDVEELAAGILRAGNLTKRLMSVARRELGTSTPVRTDLCAAVAAQEQLVRLLLPPGIDLRLELDAAGRFAVLPGTLVEQVLVNLVTNAREAMGVAGTVTIRVRSHEGGTQPGLVLEVSDTGHGIPIEAQASLFDAFFSAGGGKGSGIGLASVRALVQTVGGTVTVESQPGAGATFRLTFPEHRESDRRPGGHRRPVVTRTAA